MFNLFLAFLWTITLIISIANDRSSIALILLIIVCVVMYLIRAYQDFTCRKCNDLED